LFLMDLPSHFVGACPVVKITHGQTRVREDVLRDPRYPVHQIADGLIPYLRVLVDQFEPERVILFGSYAYGQPSEDSDVDLLVVQRVRGGARAAATEIRKAFQPLRRTGVNLPFDIMVRDPADLDDRIRRGASFHSEITTRGLTVA
jgi:predicted nucleotidyltransferase